jgi:hypothetical protein
MIEQLHQALDLMRMALELLDTANESTASPHLDLAIARLEEALQNPSTKGAG